MQGNPTNNILFAMSFGKTNRFKILPLFWVEVRREIKIKSNQWCLGYKVVQVGAIAIYYHSPMIS